MNVGQETGTESGPQEAAGATHTHRLVAGATPTDRLMGRRTHTGNTQKSRQMIHVYDIILTIIIIIMYTWFMVKINQP